MPIQNFKKQSLTTILKFLNRSVTDFNQTLERTFFGDEVLAMRPDLIKPYAMESLNKERTIKIFNCPLSRARGTLKNGFGICCVLHSFLHKKFP